MKNLITLTAILTLLSVKAYAINVKSEIKEVTIYQRNAKITRESTVSIPAGITEILMEDLTSSILQNSLQVDIEGRAILLSATSRINYMTHQKESPRIKELKDSLELVNNEINWLQNQRAVYQGEEKVINENNRLGSEQEGLSVDELEQLVSFYRSRLLEVKREMLKIDKKIKDLKLVKSRIQNQLNELSSTRNKPTGEIIINVSSNISTKIGLKISYLTPNAAWSPVYDIRADGTDKPIKLIYKANVYQQTGYDWKDVKLTISTGNPTVDNNRPILYPWHIDIYVPPPPTAYGTKQRQLKSAEQSQMMQLNIAQEVEFDDLDAEAEMPLYMVTETTSQMAAEYNIEVLQDIPSDGKEHLVAMKEYEPEADFTYHTVPKLSDGAFLLAKVPDYGQYNLLPGKANLFFQGMYVGQSTINPVTTADTLLVSLGRDNKISVKRNQLKDFTSKQVIGGNVKEIKGYEIFVRNNNVFPVNLEVLDQIPISNNKDIEVKLEDNGGADYIEDYGKLLWKLDLNAGQTKNLRFVFSVKYPKDKKIRGL
ncbi:MAG: DUF4139 domain-containing protein [Bacteroidales bacterium]|nr:MAG: DUF4139 domain-containing protein [Bacteroidales bacterium]